MYRIILVLISVLSLLFLGLSQSSGDSINLAKDPAQRFLLVPDSTGNQIIHHTGYCLSYDERAEQAEWVFYKLTTRSEEHTSELQSR